MCSILKSEFQMKNFGFNFYREDVIYTAQWRWPPTVFLTYRVVLGACVLGYCLYSIAVEASGKHFIYMTNQAFIIQAIALSVAAVVTVNNFFNTRGKKKIDPVAEMNGEPSAPTSPSFLQTADVEEGTGGKAKIGSGKEQQEQRLAWYYQLSWLLSSIADITALVVTLTYWGALYPFSSYEVDYDNAIKHAVNSVIVVIDGFISARPTRLLHSAYTVGYGLAYMVFSLIYWSVDNNNVIYSILDWNKPGLAVGVVLGLVLVVVPLLTLFRFGIYRLRLRVYENIYGKLY